MKTYIYKITKRQRDTNGNPRSLVTVYRIKKNVPVLLDENVGIGFRGDRQAVEDIIQGAENWSKKRIKPKGWYDYINPVHFALHNNEIRLIAV